MATIVTRSGKGAALTHTEMDANFTNINTEVGTKVDSLADLSITATDSEIDVLDMSSSGSSSGQVLTSTGTGTVPTWQDAAGGGKVLQVVYSTDGTETTTTSTSYVASSITGIITPSSTSSKILVFASIVCGTTGTAINADRLSLALTAGGSAIFEPDAGARFGNIYAYNSNNVTNMSISFEYLHSPATTSAITYSIQLRSRDGGTVKVNQASGISSLTMMEIGA